jgi:hypothetical protein
MAKKMTSAPGEHHIFSYDGQAEFLVKDFQDFLDAFEDPFYLETVRPDEAAFIDLASAVVAVGQEYVVIDDSKAVHTHHRDFKAKPAEQK